jgi:hypothetical protein
VKARGDGHSTASLLLPHPLQPRIGATHRPPKWRRSPRTAAAARWRRLRRRRRFPHFGLSVAPLLHLGRLASSLGAAAASPPPAYPHRRRISASCVPSSPPPHTRKDFSPRATRTGKRGKKRDANEHRRCDDIWVPHSPAPTCHRVTQAAKK